MKATEKTKEAVVLLNFGGPRNLAEVPEFLYQILSDPNTIQLPLPQFFQNLLAKKITKRRAEETARQYQEIGGRSPIVEKTESISAALKKKLEQLKDPPKVDVVHRYIPQWSQNTARKLVEEGVGKILALPLYPHFSYATTGSSLEQLTIALEKEGYQGTLEAVSSYPDDEAYLEALSDKLSQVLKALPPKETLVLCSAHGLPVAYVKRGDPYEKELALTMAGLKKRFPDWQMEMVYQSRVGPAEWLKPYTDEYLEKIPEEHPGIKHVVFLPLSFVNDHIETLYEIGVTYANQARGRGLEPHLVPAIESHPSFMHLLAEKVNAWQQDQPGIAKSPKTLLPPDQFHARYGRWAWALWGILFIWVLAHALW